MVDKRISEFIDGGLVQTDDEIPAVRGGQNYKVNVGSAAALDVGSNIGDIVVLEDVGGLPALPAVDASQLLNLPANPTGLTLVSINDADFGYLEDKIIAGANVTINKITDSSGVEFLEIQATGGGGGGTILLSDIESISNGTIVANISGSSNSPSAVTLSSIATAMNVPVLDSDDQIPLSNARREVMGPYSLTSVSSITITGIPSWAKFIKVVANNPQTSPATPFNLRLGVSSIISTGYNGTITELTSSVSSGNFSTAFPLIPATLATDRSLIASLMKEAGSNVWHMTCISNAASSSTGTCISSGYIDAAGVVDRIQIFNNGMTFTSGSVTLIIEG